MSEDKEKKKVYIRCSAKDYREFVRDMIRMRKKKWIDMPERTKPWHQTVTLLDGRKIEYSESLVSAYLHAIDIVNEREKDEKAREETIREIEEEIENIRKQISRMKSG